jgi:hypothetical protein
MSYMSRSEVYSWRLEPDLKRRLQAAAREEGTSVGSLLDRIARDWLREQPSREEQQRRLHAEALKVIGTISSGNRYGSERVKDVVRQRIFEKHKWRATERTD